MTKILKGGVPYQEILYSQLQDDDYAAEHVIAAAEDGNKDVLLLALRDLANARGGMSKLAQETKLDRGQLYRTLSESGNPRLDSLLAILDSLGLELSLKPKASKVA